jgi:hypothetical protein
MSPAGAILSGDAPKGGRIRKNPAYQECPASFGASFPSRLQCNTGVPAPAKQ